MYTQEQLENIFFLDIETASATESFEALPERMKPLWERKALRYVDKNSEWDPAEVYTGKAAIHAEFGRVVCISCGYLRFQEGVPPELRIKSYYGEDEAALLADFREGVNTFCARPNRFLCAHNGKEFDFPYLGRRYLIHGQDVPYVLQVQGKKPWETAFIDTMELWKFGDFKNYTSLETLAAVFNIPSSKDDIDGSQVSTAFYNGEIERIKTYCEKDVAVTAQVLLRLSGQPSEISVITAT